jgi:hypothetical protein
MTAEGGTVSVTVGGMEGGNAEGRTESGTEGGTESGTEGGRCSSEACIVRLRVLIHAMPSYTPCTHTHHALIHYSSKHCMRTLSP